MRLLIAEDNRDMSAFLARALKEEGFSVDVSYDGEDALYRIKSEPFDVVILDCMMPKMSGLDVVKEVRAGSIPVPILLLTAKDTTNDMVRGLNAGADDYLTKPFKFEVLLARLHAISRRHSGVQGTVLSYADIKLDLVTHRASRSGRNLALLPKEEALLAYFLRNSDRILSRTLLYEHVWNDTYDGISNTLEVHIGELRKKMEAQNGERLLHTARGRGYILSKDPPR